jgi:hypothetical protein
MLGMQSRGLASFQYVMLSLWEKSRCCRPQSYPVLPYSAYFSGIQIGNRQRAALVSTVAADIPELERQIVLKENKINVLKKTFSRPRPPLPGFSLINSNMERDRFS